MRSIFVKLTLVFALCTSFAAAQLDPNSQINWAIWYGPYGTTSLVIAGSGAPSATCSATVNNGAFVTNAAGALYQCSNAVASTYQWNLLAHSTGYVTAVTGTAPVVSSGGTTPVISMHVADSSDNGYLSSADWATFNGKGTGNISGTVSNTYLTMGTGAGTIGNSTATYAAGTYTFPQALVDQTSITAPITNGCYTLGPASGGDDTATINAAINAARNWCVSLYPGQIYKALGQLTFSTSLLVFNSNGSVIETLYTAGPPVKVMSGADFVHLNDLWLVPGAATPYAALEDAGWGLQINKGGVLNINNNSPASWGTTGIGWYYNLQYDSDEQATLNDWNEQANFPILGNSNSGAQSTIRCDPTFCGSAIYNPPGGGNTAILKINTAALSMGCSGNGIDWEGANELITNNVTYQSYNQFGLKVFGGSVNEIAPYNSNTVCSGTAGTTKGNPAFNNVLASAAIVLGNSTHYTSIGAGTGGFGEGSAAAATCTSGNCVEDFGYYVVIHNAGSSTSFTKPIYLGVTGYAVDPSFTSSSVLITAPTSPGTSDTCDFLAVDQGTSATFSQSGPIIGSGSNTYAITGEQGVACSPAAGTYISFTDTGSRGSYTFTTPGTLYGPNIGANGWPGAGLILAGTNTTHAYFVGPCPIAGSIIIPDYAGSQGVPYATCTNQTVDGYSGNSNGSTSALVSSLGGFNYQTFTPSATMKPFYYSATPPRLKGLYNFGANDSYIAFNQGPTEVVTILDSNPGKTLAQPGNRPSWDAGDTAIGVDQPTGGIASQDALSNSAYINNPIDGGDYLERLTASLKSLYLPTSVFNAFTVGQITTTPGIGTIVGYTTGGFKPSGTYYYIVQGAQVGGYNSANSTPEKSATTGACTGPGNTCRVAFNVTGIGNYPGYNVYIGTSTGTEVGPCNGKYAPGLVPAYVTTFTDTVASCTGSSPTNTNTMPAGSFELNGSTPMTSTSSANSQVVTCPTGGTGTQVCDASGAWIAPGSSGTVTSIATTSPITGGTITSTGTIACATCVTSAASLTANGFVTGAGSQATQTVAITGIVAGNGASAPAAATAAQLGTLVNIAQYYIPVSTGTASAMVASSIQDNGTTVSTTEPVATTSTVSTGSSPPTPTPGTAGYMANATGTCPAGTASVGSICPNSADGTYYENVNNGTYQHWPQTAFSTSSYTNATTSFSSITGLAFTVAASTNYHMHCNLIWSTGTATGGPKYQITGPATPTAVVIQMNSAVTAATSASAAVAAFSSTLNPVGAVVTTGTDEYSTLDMDLVNGTTAGTVQVQAAAQGTGTLTIVNGSGCQFQ